jgi:hypothetical protein
MNRSLQVTEEYLSDRDQTTSNQLRVLSEKLRASDSEAIRFRTDLQNEKEKSFQRHQDLESERISLRTENAILQEKMSQARFELDDMKLRVNSGAT